MDPLGNKIILPDNICDENGAFIQTEDIYDDVASVIQKPAMAFEVQDANIQNYYFRSVGWEHCLLISAIKENGHFKAYDCLKNPSPEKIRKLFRIGRRLI